MRKNVAKGTKVNVKVENVEFRATVVKAFAYRPFVVVVSDKTNREIEVPMANVTYAR